MKRKKRVAVIITEYWEDSHADVFITKMIKGFSVNGVKYESTLEIAAMYVDLFQETDLSRDLAVQYGIPMFSTVEQALKCGGDTFNLDGIVIIGEHGEYPTNEFGQMMYPRREFFEICLNVMLKADRIVPVFTDKGFAIVREDIEWMYEQVNKHEIPFMSSSSIPFCFQYPTQLPIPSGAPLQRMFGFILTDVEKYGYHTLEMLQSIAERRAYGESGIKSIVAYEGEKAIEHLLNEEWLAIYRALGGFINLNDVDAFPHSLDRPVFIVVNYADGLQAGMLYANEEINKFAAAFQIYETEQPLCTEFYCQWQKPFVHSAIFVLELERFIHTGRTLYPLERSLLTTGANDAIMKSLYYKKEIETPYLLVNY
ncbi:hypothetical protein [Paenibacillus eucommiae]|uniref:Uncharacterized protein n=1 Tax=Paenibacillus eucommiae TaxID=1355755 RepID=A0ABS4J030_9BACL|nr:hypothetical protein [Paenibacillus eucommiae]MBP1993202.1 hypothetical protein [Paenibacillus eucommiae]